MRAGTYLLLGAGRVGEVLARHLNGLVGAVELRLVHHSRATRLRGRVRDAHQVGCLQTQTHNMVLDTARCAGVLTVGSTTKPGRLPIDTEIKPGRLPVDTEIKPGRLLVDTEIKPGRLPVDTITNPERLPADPTTQLAQQQNLEGCLLRQDHTLEDC